MAVEVTTEKIISKRRCSEKFDAMRYNSNAIVGNNGDYFDPNLNKVKYVDFHKYRRVAIKYVYSAIFVVRAILSRGHDMQ